MECKEQSSEEIPRIIPLRNPALYGTYRKAALRWLKFIGAQEDVYPMCRARFVLWLQTVDDDTLHKEMRKWALDPSEWTAIDLEETEAA